jgi:CRP/FNR family transcriptional activator FtrB
MTLDKNDCRDTGFFAKFGDASFASFIDASYIQTTPANISFITALQQSDLIFTLIDGKTLMFGNIDDRPVALKLQDGPQMIQLGQAVLGHPYEWSVKTLTDSQIVVTPTSVLQKLFEEDTDVRRAVTEEIATSHRVLQHDLFNHKFRRSAHRLAYWILGEVHKSPDTVDLKLSFEKRILASLLGMSPENLTRSFVALSSRGVKCNGRMVVITDQNKLEKFVQFGSIA